MLEEMQEGIEKEDMQASMQILLREMPLRSTRHLWEQESMPMLCKTQDTWKQA